MSNGAFLPRHDQPALAIDMNISSVTPSAPSSSERLEPKGPDVSNDRDGDDAAAKAPVQAAAPQGQGAKVDVMA